MVRNVMRGGVGGGAPGRPGIIIVVEVYSRVRDVSVEGLVLETV